MIVLLDNVIHSYEDPILLFCHYAMYISRQIQSFYLLSIETQSIEQYLTSFHTHGDYLSGKLGPKSLRNMIWQNKRYGPAFKANNERVMSILANEKNQLSNVEGELNKSIIPLLSNNADKVSFSKIWEVLISAERHFKLPHEITVDPVKSLSRVLKWALKYSENSTATVSTDFKWIFQYFIISETQRNDLEKLLHTLREKSIALPMVSILMVIADFQRTILNFRSSRFLKESVPISDFARFCILVRHHIFSKFKNSRKDLVLFWREIWNEWSNLSDEERKRRMIGSSGVYRGWADQDELKLFVPTSEDSDSDTEWFTHSGNSSLYSSQQETGLELIRESDGESLTIIDAINKTKKKEFSNSANSTVLDNDEQDSSFSADLIPDVFCKEPTSFSNEYNKRDSTNSIHSHNFKNMAKLQKESLNESEAVQNLFINSIDSDISQNTFDEQNDDWGGLVDTINEIDEQLVEHDKKHIKGERKISESAEILMENEEDDLNLFDINLVSSPDTYNLQEEIPLAPNKYDVLRLKENLFNDDSLNGVSDIETLKRPGILTAMLDEPSSVPSSAFNSDVDDINTQLKPVYTRDDTIPERIQMFEKLSGSSFKPKTYNHGSTFDTDIAETNTSSLKRALKPPVKRPTSSKVMELKEFIEKQPELITLKSEQNFEANRKEPKKIGIVKKGRSISEIFSALLDDNMRDLSLSAEYKNKIVRPQDLYNRIKLDTDKPWDFLSTKTKKKYYDAFLRKYDTVLNKPENLTLDIVDLLEVVKVCVDFEDVHHKIVQYAVNLVENEDECDRNDSDDCTGNQGANFKTFNRGSFASLQNFRRSPVSIHSSADSIRSLSPR